MSRIGFVLLTHASPPQILRLVHRLNSMFDFPPIVCHHDFGKCPLPDGFLPQNVEFVRPHLSTGWAEYSVVEATQRAVAQLYEAPNSPDWCMIISGSCYPTKPAAQILANLSAGGYDAHIDASKIVLGALDTRALQIYFTRFCVKVINIPWLDKRLRPRTFLLRLPYKIGRLLLPYRKKMRCHAGSQWFSLNRSAAEYLTKFQKTPAAVALIRHLRPRLFSEECYFQTALCSAPHLKIHPDNQVYLDWSELKFHPKLLTLEDLPAITASPTHFARKMDAEASADLLDALDQIIDGKSEGSRIVSPMQEAAF